MNIVRISRFNLKNQLVWGLVYLLMLYAIASMLGAFTDVTSASAIRIRNAALGMPLFTVFTLISTHFLMHRCYIALQHAVKNSPAQKYTHLLLTAFFLRVKKLKWLSVLLGVVITFSYLYAENLLATEWTLLELFMNVSALPFWASAFYFICTCLYSTKYVIANFLDRESLDLFSLKELKPISDLVIYNTALCACTMAIIPVFWLNKTVPTIDIAIVLLVFCGLALYLFLPVFKVQQIVSNKKTLAIARLNQAINALMKKNSFGSHEAILKESQVLRELASLISTKKEIHAASEWPIDLPQGLKGILLGVSIPLSWAAGSLVESIISGMDFF